MTTLESFVENHLKYYLYHEIISTLPNRIETKCPLGQRHCIKPVRGHETIDFSKLNGISCLAIVAGDGQIVYYFVEQKQRLVVDLLAVD